MATAVAVTTVAPAFTISGTPGTLTLKQGANGTVLLSLTANATFSGAVTLACAGAPANGTCSFDVSTVALNPGTTTAATLIIGTTGTVASAKGMSSPWQGVTGAIGVAGLLGFFLIRRRQLRFPSALGLSLVAFAILGISGCSGSGSKTTAPVTPTVPVVATGSYTIMVTATADGNGAPSLSTMITLQVQ